MPTAIKPQTTGMLWWKREIPAPQKGPNMKEVSEAMIQALDAYLSHLRPKDRKAFKAALEVLIVTNEPPALSDVLQRIEKVSEMLRAA